MITFTYLTNTLQLRNPDLGNPEYIDTHTVHHITKSGRVYSYTKEGKTQRLTLSFRLLTPAQVTSLRSFITTAEGNIVTYTDQHSETWSVKIVSNPLRQTVLKSEDSIIIIELEGTKDA